MPPIPIYIQSPINAAKASGATPQTDEAPEEAGRVPAANDQPPVTTTTAAVHAQAHAHSHSPPQGGGGYPPARPGAVPSLPAPTGTVPSHHAPVHPTPTQRLADPGPPPPQPGAVPTPPGGGGGWATTATTATLPPPPRAGEAYHEPEPTQAPMMPYYPSQMAIPAPAAPYYPSAQRGTATATGGAYYAPAPQNFGGETFDPEERFEHPPGYHQNINASEFDSNKRSAHLANVSYEQRSGIASGDEGDDGVWDAAKKLVHQAGEKLSAAEGEVWRMINKD